MTLSKLQRYILLTVWESPKPRISRQHFYQFYAKLKKAPAKKLQTNIITTSIERLIDRGLIIGYGQKTQHKLFITHVKLTTRGKKITKPLLGQQVELPIFKKNYRSTPTRPQK